MQVLGEISCRAFVFDGSQICFNMCIVGVCSTCYRQPVAVSPVCGEVFPLCTWRPISVPVSVCTRYIYTTVTGSLWPVTPCEEVFPLYVPGSLPVQASTSLAVLCPCHAESGRLKYWGPDQPIHTHSQVSCLSSSVDLFHCFLLPHPVNFNFRISVHVKLCFHITDFFSTLWLKVFSLIHLINNTFLQKRLFCNYLHLQFRFIVTIKAVLVVLIPLTSAHLRS